LFGYTEVPSLFLFFFFLRSKVKPITEDDFSEKIGVLFQVFQGLYSRLDGIAELLKTFIEQQRETTQGPSACSTPIQPKLNKKLVCRSISIDSLKFTAY